MPRWLKPMKDVKDGETRRGVVNKRWSDGIRMEKSRPLKSGWGHIPQGVRPGDPGKRNILVPGGKEIERDSVSSGERKRKSLNLARGVAGSDIRIRKVRRMFWNGQLKKVKVLYSKTNYYLIGYLSTTEHVKFCGNLGRPISKAKYFSGPIVN